MNWYKKAKLEDIPEELQRMFGLGNFKPKQKYVTCKKCGNKKAYYKEEHPDTDMNEIILYCPNCGELD